jgi:formyl-CoA transferase
MGLTGAIDPVAAPLLGEHTEDVLRDVLGYDQRRIAAFTQKGVFGPGRPSTPV